VSLPPALRIRPAIEADAAAIAAMVARHARLGNVLPRGEDNIRETLADWVVAEEGAAGEGTVAPGNVDAEAFRGPAPASPDRPPILACGSLWVYGPHLAEVRSLIVSDAAQGRGAGAAIVDALADLARGRGIDNLFTLTRAVGFFERQRFEITDKERFPEKVWKDCQLCPLMEDCDETALIRPISVPRAAESGSDDPAPAT
jgi:amino-acid N-acetyltransferase